MESEKALYITTLGQFSLRYPTYDGPGIISDQDGASWRLMSFLQYLCFFHDRAVTQDEIFDLLWSDIDSTNPTNTTKTLLHRSRLLLENLGFADGKKVLRYRRGLYFFDPELPIRMDTAVFEELCGDFYAKRNSTAGLNAARQAIKLYQGDFLPNAAGSAWLLSPRTYYRSKYLRMCHDAAFDLREMGRLDEAIKICRLATAQDPYNESCHQLLMRLLCDSGAKQEAIQYYNDVSDLFMLRLGVAPSEDMTALYRELSSGDRNGTPELDLRTILAGLQGEDQESGVLFCDYAAFRDIYGFLVQLILRSGQAAQLSLITLLDIEGKSLPQLRRNMAMEEMRRAIGTCCRSEDVCTQFSASQYLLLLPSAGYENGGSVLRRVVNEYQKTLIGKTTCTKFSTMSAFVPERQWTPSRSAACLWNK